MHVFLVLDPSSVNQCRLSLYIEQKMYSVSFHSVPQEMLTHVASFLGDHGVRPTELSGIGVLMEDGTFTSLRTATTIANIFHLASGVPLAVLSKEDRDDPEAIEEAMKRSLQNTSYLSPTYASFPHIGKTAGSTL